MGAPVILITGALTGIGRATALAFANEGSTVVASGRREAEGKALEAELRSLGVEAAFIPADVRHEDDVRNLVEQTVARFGRLDVAVNNAGTEGKPGPLTDRSATLNMHSTVIAAHAVCRPVIERVIRGQLVREPVTLPNRVAMLYLNLSGSRGLPNLRGICAAPLLSDVCSTSGAGFPSVPALLTATSSLPKRPTVRSMRSRTDSS